MYSDSNTPRIRPRGAGYYFLTDSDILQEGDLVRRIDYPNTYSDYVDYGYTRDMDWRKVGQGLGEELGAWIGATVGHINKVCRTEFEVVRHLKYDHVEKDSLLRTQKDIHQPLHDGRGTWH